MNLNIGYSFDDVLLLPQYTEAESRGESNISTYIGGLRLQLPILSAPMDTVTEENMATFMWSKGGLGVIHRYNTVNKQYSMVKWVKEMGARVAAAIGINGDTKDRVQALLEAEVDMLVIDIAHGHMRKALEMVDYIKGMTSVQVMSGNIVTKHAAEDYISAGADVLRVGIGPGSACSTRLVAGVGCPQLSAIAVVAEVAQNRVAVVGDGGIKTSGDVVKALAAGADAVMVGGLLAPFSVAAGKTISMRRNESPVFGELFGSNSKESPESYVMMKEFRGMASDDALSERGRKENYLIEGESFLVPVRYDHDKFVNQLRDGIQAGFAYLGAKDIIELRSRADFVIVSANGSAENGPNFKGVAK